MPVGGSRAAFGRAVAPADYPATSRILGSFDGKASLAKARVLLIGGSIIDNGAYVNPGEPDVTEQLRVQLPQHAVVKRALCDSSLFANGTAVDPLTDRLKRILTDCFRSRAMPTTHGASAASHLERRVRCRRVIVQCAHTVDSKPRRDGNTACRCRTWHPLVGSFSLGRHSIHVAEHSQCQPEHRPRYQSQGILPREPQPSLRATPAKYAAEDMSRMALKTPPRLRLPLAGRSGCWPTGDVVTDGRLPHDSCPADLESAQRAPEAP
jgi:hypothetical protein